MEYLNLPPYLMTGYSPPFRKADNHPAYALLSSLTDEEKEANAKRGLRNIKALKDTLYKSKISTQLHGCRNQYKTASNDRRNQLHQRASELKRLAKIA